MPGPTDHLSRFAPPDSQDDLPFGLPFDLSRPLTPLTPEEEAELAWIPPVRQKTPEEDALDALFAEAQEEEDHLLQEELARHAQLEHDLADQQENDEQNEQDTWNNAFGLDYQDGDDQDDLD